jgi:hypothetical protein
VKVLNGELIRLTVKVSISVNVSDTVLRVLAVFSSFSLALGLINEKYTSALVSTIWLFSTLNPTSIQQSLQAT